MLGQVKGDPEHLKKAQQYYQLVGASASECDTIPGRQCMASCFFLLKQFEDVLVFLSVRARGCRAREGGVRLFQSQRSQDPEPAHRARLGGFRDSPRKGHGP